MPVVGANQFVLELRIFVTSYERVVTDACPIIMPPHRKYWIGFELESWALRASDGSLVSRFESDEEALRHALKVITEDGQAVSSVIHSSDKKLVSILCMPKDGKGGGASAFVSRPGEDGQRD